LVPLSRNGAVLWAGCAAGYVSPSGNATFTIGGTNVTDKRYITTGQPQFAGGVVFGTYNAPREWYAIFGVTL
jgi:iron complex outermembrane receptor protein